MPLVSILLPAFRAEFLDLAVASALGQTFRDFELVISDDSTGNDIEAVISKWSDNRIRYLRNPRERVPASNRDHLLSLVTGKYVKFLFDDDFLFPDNLQRLASAAVLDHAQLVFSSWHCIDAVGRTLSSYEPPVDSGRILRQDTFFEDVIMRTANFIGGPSGCLLEKAALDSIPEPFGLDGIRMRFLTDVALYLNFAHRDFTIVGLPFFGSVFRRHSTQTSSEDGPAFSAGLFEWELFQRWSSDHGHVTVERCQEALKWRHQSYQPYLDKFPELASFVALGSAPSPEGLYLTTTFLTLLESAYRDIEARRAHPPSSM